MISVLATRRLRLEPHHPLALAALVDSVSRYREVSGLEAAPGLREFFVGGEVPAAWLAALQAAEAPDPWVHGFAVIDDASGLVVGSGGLKGEPGPDGVAEIAYGIVPSCEGRGYATEVAEALARFASGDPRVRVLRAHTLPEANASTRVLTKLGFARTGEVVDPDDGPIWRWERAPLAP